MDDLRLFMDPHLTTTLADCLMYLRLTVGEIKFAKLQIDNIQIFSTLNPHGDLY